MPEVKHLMVAALRPHLRQGFFEQIQSRRVGRGGDQFAPRPHAHRDRRGRLAAAIGVGRAAAALGIEDRRRRVFQRSIGIGSFAAQGRAIFIADRCGIVVFRLV